MLCSLALTPSLVSAEESVSVDDKDFQKELLTIEEKVTALKKNAFSAKGYVESVAQLVVQGNVSGSKANIWQINQLNGTYVIKSASYVLDGTPIYNINDASGDLGSKSELMVYDGEMGVDDHTLTVELNWQVLVGDYFLMLMTMYLPFVLPRPFHLKRVRTALCVL